MTLNVEQKLEIHELLSRAAYAFDVQDMTLLEACFAKEAEFSMRIADGDTIGPFVGRPAVMKLFTDSIAVQTDVRRHVISNIFFESKDDPIEVISNLTLIATENGEIALLTAALYRDTVIFEDDEWRLHKRFIQLDKSY
ncbi:MAG: 3-phenylpropionate/cinnamic acid dioxygenase small subunit [Halieaceae bacterium]|jgi:3-phenylpropionate/cinnamic acid dioxygenase small subunit